MSARGGPQLIPRPESSNAGGPPPWAELRPPQRVITTRDLRAAFEGRVGAPSFVEATGAARASAVLAPFYDLDGELYTVLTQFSNSLTFAGGGTPTVNGPALLLGDSSTTLETVDTIIGRRELPFCNEINGVTYQYMRVYTIVAGTIATGINYTAFVVQQFG